MLYLCEHINFKLSKMGVKKLKTVFAWKEGAEEHLIRIQAMGGKGSIVKKNNSEYVITFYFEDEDGSLSKRFPLGTPVIEHYMIGKNQFERAGEVVKSGKTTSPKGISLYKHNIRVTDKNIVIPNWKNVESFYEANERNEKKLKFRVKK